MPFIYSISDKSTGEVLYIGSTTQSIQKRLTDNMRRLKHSIPEGVEPEIKSLQWCSSKDRFLIELTYIDMFKSMGYNLLNVCNPHSYATLTVTDRIKRLQIMMQYQVILIDELQQLLGSITSTK